MITSSANAKAYKLENNWYQGVKSEFVKDVCGIV